MVVVFVLSVIQREGYKGEFSFSIIINSKLYLRTADYTMKKACGIYEIKNNKGRISYKIFADKHDLQIYLDKNKDKTCLQMAPIFSVDEYKEFDHTQIRKLTSDEIIKYMSER